MTLYICIYIYIYIYIYSIYIYSMYIYIYIYYIYIYIVYIYSIKQVSEAVCWHSRLLYFPIFIYRNNHKWWNKNVTQDYIAAVLMKVLFTVLNGLKAFILQHKQLLEFLWKSSGHKTNYFVSIHHFQYLLIFWFSGYD